MHLRCPGTRQVPAQPRHADQVRVPAGAGDLPRLGVRRGPLQVRGLQPGAADGPHQAHARQGGGGRQVPSSVTKFFQNEDPRVPIIVWFMKYCFSVITRMKWLMKSLKVTLTSSEPRREPSRRGNARL